MAKHPEESISALALSPNKSVNARANLRYTITGLPRGTAMQKFYIGTTYIYVIQRKDTDTYLSRCLMNKDTKKAVCQDYMILRNFGHGQTLEWFEYNSKAYFWIACKANIAYDKKWAMQVGRIQYLPGEEISDYTKVTRFAHLNCANKNAKSFGSVKRVDAALSSDKTKLFLWVQNTNNVIQYSYYKTSVLNSLLDSKESASSKYVSFEGNSTLKTACYGSFTQSGSNRVLPNGSCQGVEFSDAASIYIIGGNTGETPKIAKMTGSGSNYKYSCLVTAKNSDFNSETESEGIQLKGDYVYFGTCHKSTKGEKQFIYSVLKSAF